jgi:hypothetical protein
MVVDDPPQPGVVLAYHTKATADRRGGHYYTTPELASRLNRLPDCNEDEPVPLDVAGGLGCQGRFGFSAGCSGAATVILAG